MIDTALRMMCTLALTRKNNCAERRLSRNMDDFVTSILGCGWDEQKQPQQYNHSQIRGAVSFGRANIWISGSPPELMQHRKSGREGLRKGGLK